MKTYFIFHSRYIVASRDLKAGELVLKELPAALGPQIETAPLCLNCHRPLASQKHAVTCPKCKKAPFCNKLCSGGGHSEAECNLFKSKNKITAKVLLANCHIITPLRCILVKKHNPLVWNDLIIMETHLEPRRDTPIWRKHKTDVEDILYDFDIITKKDKEEEIVQKVCGILDVNAFEVRIPGYGAELVQNPSECLRGLYIQAALMAHDCIGNTHLAVDDNFNLIVHSSVPVSKGDPILFNYSNALQVI